MKKIKCITFDKKAQENLPKWVKDKMREDRKQAETDKGVTESIKPAPPKG